MIVKVDVDHRRKLSRRELDRRAVCALVRIVAVDDRRSPSGRGWHRRITVEPAPKTAMETVALQLLFGSDVVREAFNIQRARLVDAQQVSPFFAQRWNRFYATSNGKVLGRASARSGRSGPHSRRVREPRRGSRERQRQRRLPSAVLGLAGGAPDQSSGERKGTERYG